MSGKTRGRNETNRHDQGLEDDPGTRDKEDETHGSSGTSRGNVAKTVVNWGPRTLV